MGKLVYGQSQDEDIEIHTGRKQLSCIADANKKSKTSELLQVSTFFSSPRMLRLSLTRHMASSLMTGSLTEPNCTRPFTVIFDLSRSQVWECAELCNICMATP